MTSSWARRPTVGEIDAVITSARAADLLTSDDTAAIFHDLDLLEARLDELVAAFPDHALHTIAIKANPLVEILRFAVERGGGLEAASFEEVMLAQAAGCPPERIVYDSPAKTAAELTDALALGVRINADSFDELDRIIAVRSDTSTSVVGLRINPLVGDGSIPTTSVAEPGSRFGVPVDQVVDGLVARAEGRPWLRCLHYHVGSQGISLDAHAAAATVIEDLRGKLYHRLGRNQFDTIDVGGGATTDYTGEGATDPADFRARVEAAAPSFFGAGTTVITEFGRAIHANCGWALSNVEYVDTTADPPVAVLHLGADFLLRPAYQPEHWRHRFTARPARDRASRAPSIGWTVSGPLCFAGDIIARDADLGDLRAGDEVVIHDVGAYTLGMWSRHCSRGIPAVLGHRRDAAGEVQVTVLRARESAADIVRFWSKEPFGAPMAPPTLGNVGEVGSPPRRISLVTLLVTDYDEAITFFVDVCGFEVVEDRDEGRKRWVVVRPVGAQTGIVLAVPSTDEQRPRVGDQVGDRVGLFLHTDDFARDHARMTDAGVRFLEEPRREPYGTVAVWEDPWGNRWDLLQPT